MTEWYEVDMNNSKCWALYKKQMKIDLQEMFRYFKETGIQRIVTLEETILVLNLTNQTNIINFTDLDLSNYVPSIAKFVYLRLRIKDTVGYPCLMSVRPKDSILMIYPSVTHDPNDLYATFVWVKLGTNKKIQYNLTNPANAAIDIRIYGYIEEYGGGGK